MPGIPLSLCHIDLRQSERICFAVVVFPTGRAVWGVPRQGFIVCFQRPRNVVKGVLPEEPSKTPPTTSGIYGTVSGLFEFCAWLYTTIIPQDLVGISVTPSL